VPRSPSPYGGQHSQTTHANRHTHSQTHTHTRALHAKTDLVIGVDAGDTILDSRQQTANCRQQTADNRQQTTDNRQQTTDNRQQTTDNRQQTRKGDLVVGVDTGDAVFVHPQHAQQREGGQARHIRNVAAQSNGYDVRK
jgi:endo-alpha-1,4-polygalactosaminidase (GH114 family)